MKPRDKITQRMTRDGLVQDNQTTGETQGVSGRDAERVLSPPVQEDAPAHAGGAAEKLLDRAATEHDAHKARKAARRGNRDIRQGEAVRQRPSSRLQFTEEERAAPELQKYIRKSDKQADKLDAARDAIPKKRVLHRERIFDEASGKGKTKLRFDKVDKPAPKLRTNPASRPIRELAGVAHGKIHEVEGENVGVESGHKGEELIERGTGSAIRWEKKHRRLKPYRKAVKAERRAVRANTNYLYQKALYDNPQLASGNPLNHFFQKQRLKRQYAQAARAAKSAGSAAQTTQKTAKAASTAAKRAAAEAKKTASFVVRHWKGCLIILAALLLIMLLIGGLQSCSLLFGSAGGGVGISSYQAEDADILAAEAAYCALEVELQDYLDNYERAHSYDEYHYNLDEIEHDPYVLISILSALHDGAWTADEVTGTLQMLFDKQYVLTETVVKERRYYIETDTWTDEDGNTHTDSYRVYYDYFICTVTLENFNLSHVPVYIMGEEDLSEYALYMSALGNRPELFGSSEYVDRYINNPPDPYEIPASALEDETFAALITEAEKYLGYPYVWGGSNPSTSFDCSGFVSWALTNSGVCNTGRLGAQGLYNISTPVSTPQPGDLVFFTGTYDTPGVSHVGIYVGNSMMLHCGDPISYSNLNSSYWQSHFYAYARPPYN